MALTQINKAGLDELALDHVFTIGASGTDHYTFQGEGLNGTVNDPTLYLTRGKTYRFENGTGAHPIQIQSVAGAGGSAYSTGVTNNAGSGTVIVEVQHDAPDVLYYQCTSHANMGGTLYIAGALADGGVTTAKLADDAVTDAKLANSINSSIAANTAKTSNATHTGDVTGSTSLTIANNAVTTAKIADQAVTLAKLPHGDGSSDGKFLRANNGADPTFETVSIPAGTTINNNADNRVITGSGTANTLEGESNVVIDSSGRLIVGTNTSRSVGDVTAQIQLEGTGFASSSLSLISNAGASAGNTPHLTLGKSRGSSDGSNTIVASGDALGQIQFSGADGTDCNTVASSIIGRVDGTTGSNDMPGNLTFNTTADGAASPTERMRIDSSGNVVVGGTSLGATGSFGIEPNGHVRTVLTSGSTGDTLLGAISGTSNGFQINISGTNSQMYRFHNGSTVTARIDSDGLKFMNDTAAANALDDYEEGTWTPSLDGSTYGGNSYGYSDRVGNYVKIGRHVMASFYISWNNFNGTGHLMIGGLPFATLNSNNIQHAGPIMTNNLTWPTNGTSVATHNWYGISYFRIYVSQNAGGWQAVACDGSAAIIGTINYIAA